MENIFLPLKIPTTGNSKIEERMRKSFPIQTTDGGTCDTKWISWCADISNLVKRRIYCSCMDTTPPYEAGMKIDSEKSFLFISQ